MSGLGDGKSSKACVSLMSLPLPWEQVALWINQIRMIRGLKKKEWGRRSREDLVCIWLLPTTSCLI